MTAAWAGTLLAVFPSASLARGLLPELPASTVLGARFALLAALAAPTFLADSLKPLRLYFPLLLILLASEAIPWLFLWGRGQDGGHTMLQLQAANQAMRIVLTAAMFGVLALAGTGREDMFLQPGHIDAPASPASAFLIRDGEPWTAVGRNMAVIISLGTLAFLWAAFRPGPSWPGPWAGCLPRACWRPAASSGPG